MAVTFDVPAPVREALDPAPERFLEALAESLDPELTESVLLFGSVRSGEATDHSDLDLVIVLTDNAPETELRRVETRCDELSATHLDAGGSPGNALEGAIDRATGMFRSGFVVEAADVRTGRFHAIFETSRLAYLLAPWRTVLASVFEEAEPIYGDAVAPKWDVGRPETRRLREAFRSWLTTLLLATAQLPYALLSSRAQHYAMEAHKWALYNCAYLLDQGPTTLEWAMTIVPGSGRLDGWLLALRETPTTSYSYVALVPVYVTYLHLATAVGFVHDR